MRTFELRLQGTDRSQTIDGVRAFVGEDSSGSFGLMAGHARFITTLVIGLARFQVGGASWTYLAVPGAVLCFDRDRLTVSTRRYLLDDDYNRISQALERQLLVEEARLCDLKDSLRQMEETVLKRLWQLGRARGVRQS